MRRVKWIKAIAVVGFLGLATTGCEKPLFPENMPRTQYERYDRMRGRYVPGQQINTFGGSEPALRERLTPPRY